VHSVRVRLYYIIKIKIIIIIIIFFCVTLARRKRTRPDDRDGQPKATTTRSSPSSSSRRPVAFRRCHGHRSTAASRPSPRGHSVSIIGAVGLRRRRCGCCCAPPVIIIIIIISNIILRVPDVPRVCPRTVSVVEHTTRFSVGRSPLSCPGNRWCVSTFIVF